MSTRLNNYTPHPVHGNNVYEVTYKSNGNHVGDIYVEVDGFYVFKPLGDGCWSGEMLGEISGFILSLNEKVKDDYCKWIDSIKSDVV